MTAFWPTDDGWPYPDTDGETVDLDSETDDDLLSLRVPPPHLYDDLDPLERQVIDGRFGLEGHPVRTLPELVADTGHCEADVQAALGSGLAKLRTHLG